MIRFARGVLLLALCFVPFTAAQASRLEPLLNIENQALARADGKPLTLAQVKQAIVVGSTRQRFWSVSPVKEGVMVGTLNIKNKHYATVDIVYTTSSFSIKYRESTNLLYQKDENGIDQIHHNYNRSLQSLRQNIAQAILHVQE